MNSHFHRSRLAICALLAGTLTTLACIAPLVWTKQVESASTATARAPLIVHPPSLSDTPTALPGTFVATLDLVDAQNMEPACNASGDLCIHTVQGTVKYYTPLPARILCYLASLTNGYSDPVDVDANASGTVTLSASDPNPVSAAPDQTDFFACTMDGEGVHLVVSKKQLHDEVEVMP
jgi:hypothetical protein